MPHQVALCKMRRIAALQRYKLFLVGMIFLTLTITPILQLAFLQTLLIRTLKLRLQSIVSSLHQYRNFKFSDSIIFLPLTVVHILSPQVKLLFRMFTVIFFQSFLKEVRIIPIAHFRVACCAPQTWFQINGHENYVRWFIMASAADESTVDFSKLKTEATRVIFYQFDRFFFFLSLLCNQLKQFSQRQISSVFVSYLVSYFFQCF